MNRAAWKVLVVEDESDAMELVRGVLEYHGIASIGATNGEDALALLQHETPTVMIIDLSLPGIDGWGLLARLKDNQKLSRVLALRSRLITRRRWQTRPLNRGLMPISPSLWMPCRLCAN